eukprot:CAMPEP_0114239022 /NCGR_PEP_ID=MMETSP0058-20121206/8229_1 /TAXON_ID=36894 /ORGANISM="Pyramimonas parkeae, CCMP726" /LENGTH=342 /DNA_ID=CAMNT_0001351157 /DNA_START=713 /DNA_END=1742 /DNA_ORIENTATION=-
MRLLSIRGCSTLAIEHFRDIGSLHSLTVLDLAHCRSVDDRCLKQLSGLSMLELLNLRDCQKVTGNGVSILVHHHPKLEHLNIEDVKDLKLADLKALSRLTLLSTLDLGGVSSSTILSEIEWMTSLTRLDLAYSCRPTNESMHAISRLSLLKDLEVNNCMFVTDTGVAYIARLTCLTTLRLKGCNDITDRGAQSLSTMSSLTSLQIKCCWRLSDVGILQFNDLEELRVLNLEGCYKVSDRAAEDLLLCHPSLTTLYLPGVGNTREILYRTKVAPQMRIPTPCTQKSETVQEAAPLCEASGQARVLYRNALVLYRWEFSDGKYSSEFTSNKIKIVPNTFFHYVV